MDGNSGRIARRPSVAAGALASEARTHRKVRQKSVYFIYDFGCIFGRLTRIYMRILRFSSFSFEKNPFEIGPK